MSRKFIPLVLFSMSACIISVQAASIVLDGSTVIDESVAYDSVTVTANVGAEKTLHVANGATIAVNATATIACPIVLGTSASGTVVIAPGSGVTATFSGVLSGLADIEVNGAGTTSFSGANTFDGKLTVVKGAFRAKSNGAFGSTAGGTVCDTGNPNLPNLYFDGVVTSEDFTLSDTWAGRVHFAGQNTLNGKVQCVMSVGTSNPGWMQFDFQANSTTTFNGPVSFAGGVVGRGANNSNAKVYWNGGVLCTSNYYMQQGVHYVTKPFDLRAGNLQARGNAEFYLQCEDAFVNNKTGVSDRYVRLVQEEENAGYKVHLACDQTIAGLAPRNYSSEFANYAQGIVIDSQNGSTLRHTATQAPNCFCGTFGGNVNLSVEGGSDVIFLGGASTSTGTLSLQNGAKVTFGPTAAYTYGAHTYDLSSYAGKWAGDVQVGDGCVLTLAAGTNLNSSKDLYLTGSATVNIPEGVTNHVRALYINGVRQAGGTWGSSSSGAAHADSRFAGKGVIRIMTYGTLTAPCTIDAGGVSYEELTVDGEGEIGGGSIMIEDGGVLRVNGTVAFAGSVVMGSGENAALTISLDVASGKSATFDGVVSGPTDFALVGPGTTIFGGENTFDGDLDIREGVFYARSDAAFGSTKGKTSFYAKSSNPTQPKLYFDKQNLTTSEKFVWTSHGGNYITFMKDTVLCGDITAYDAAGQEYWYVYDTASVTYRGAVGPIGYPMTFAAPAPKATSSSGSIYIENDFSTRYTWYAWGGFVHLRHPVTVGDRSFRPRNATYYFECEDAIGPADSCSEIHFETGDPVTFDLGCHSHHARHISRVFSHATNDVAVITSSAGGTLRLLSDTATNEEQLFLGTVTGNANLSVEGAKPLYLGGENTSIGTLTLTNGATVALAPVAGLTGYQGSWAGDVVVNEGCVLQANNALALSRQTTRLMLRSNGQVAIPAGVSLNVAELWLDGEKLEGSKYDATTLPNNITGGGRIVKPATAVWDGGAGANTSVSAAANWVGDAVPDLLAVDAPVGVTFSQAGCVGTSADFGALNAVLDGVKFTVPSFALNGTGSVTLNLLTFAPEAEGSYAFNVPVTMAAAGTLDLAADVTVDVNAPLASQNGAIVTKLGDGTLNLNATSAGIGAFAASAGLVNVTADNALGAGLADFQMDSAVRFHGVTVDNTCSFSIQKKKYGSIFPVYASLETLANTTNVFNGAVAFRDGCNLLDHVGQCMVFNGPVTIYNSLYFDGPNSSGGTAELPSVWRFNGKVTTDPTTAGEFTFFNAHTHIHFGAVSNAFGVLYKMWCNKSGSRTICDVPWAFAYTCDLELGVPANQDKSGKYTQAVFDLDGNDQGFVQAWNPSRPDVPGNTVTSARPAMLHANANCANVTNYWSFTGAAGYAFEGTGTLNFGVSSDSTGSLEVTKGTLRIVRDCRWANCTNVTARGTGVFAIEKAGAISRQATVNLFGDARMSIPENEVQRAHVLMIDGVKAPDGVYGSDVTEGPGAAYRSRFSGGGRLQVGVPGMIVVVQ